jgi:hypothetical protein
MSAMERDRGATMAERALVPLVRADTGVRHSEEVKTRAFVLWATVGGRSATATRRLLEAEADEGQAVPTDRTIRTWAAADGWAAQADGLWGDVATRGKTLHDLKLLMFTNFVLSQEVKRDAMTGAYAGREAAGVLALKAGELSDRLVERGVLTLAVPAPPQEQADESQLSRREREALADERIARHWADRRQAST